MRDVAYFLHMSCSPELLRTNERELFDYYLGCLNDRLSDQQKKAQPIKPNALWFQVRPLRVCLLHRN